MKPTLNLNKKLSSKAGILFPGAPLFDDLPDNDLDHRHPSSTSGKMTIQQLDEEKDSIDHEQDRRKLRRKRSKDPTIPQLRDHLRKIAAFHNEMVESELPSVYPILGPAGGKSDDEDLSTDDDDDNHK